MSGPQWGPEWDADGYEVDTSAPDYISPNTRELLEREADPGREDREQAAMAEDDRAFDRAFAAHLDRLADDPSGELEHRAGEAPDLGSAEGVAWPTDEQIQLAYEVDADGAVGQFLDADQAYTAARQRLGRAGDALAGLYAPIRATDREAEAAQQQLALVDQAEAAAGEWTEALQQQRDAAVRASQTRTASQGRGPAAWAARSRLANAGYDRSAHAERVAGLQAKATEAAEKVGTMDPARWGEMRAQAAAALEGRRERRAELLAEASARQPQARADLEAAQAAAQAAEDQRTAAEAELDRRGIDPGRIREAADRVRSLGLQPTPDRVSRDQVVYEQRSGELDAEREAGRDRAPSGEQQRER